MLYYKQKDSLTQHQIRGILDIVDIFHLSFFVKPAPNKAQKASKKLIFLHFLTFLHHIRTFLSVFLRRKIMETKFLIPTIPDVCIGEHHSVMNQKYHQ